MALVSHLGCELTLARSPDRCRVSGTHITPGTTVVVDSVGHRHSKTKGEGIVNGSRPGEKTNGVVHLNAKKGMEKKSEEEIRKDTIRWLQSLPLIGRVLAHGTGFYWVALQDTDKGKCEWDYN